jgi:hypothetical protein
MTRDDVLYELGRIVASMLENQASTRVRGPDAMPALQCRAKRVAASVSEAF